MRIKLVIIAISISLSFSSIGLINIYAEKTNDIYIYEDQGQDQIGFHIENFTMMKNQTDNRTNNDKLKFHYVDIDDDKDLPPVADFIYSPSSPTVGEKVILDGSKSYDKDGKVVSYRWSYVSVGVRHLPILIGSGKIIRYSWNRPGDYIIFLSIKDDDGLGDVEKKQIHVEKVTQSPVADFSFSPNNPKVGDRVNFDGSKSTDDGSIVSYEWDFGDGTTGSGKVVTHVYSKDGDYTVTLEVKDDDGLTNISKKEITITTNRYQNNDSANSNKKSGHHNGNSHHVVYNKDATLNTNVSTDMITFGNTSGDIEKNTTCYSYTHPVFKDSYGNYEKVKFDDSRTDSTYLIDDHENRDIYVYMALLLISAILIIFISRNKIKREIDGIKKLENRKTTNSGIYPRKVSPKEEIIYIPNDSRRVTRILVREL